ncbi:D-glucuronyl C5-epimerase family protein [Pseudomonas bijieensis]|uniref:D-glucuronyl C5-epimerase family protein n=1 Tax=Pseudomonas bijieensis TaxID=2681983 RepID=UPI00200C019E|nr:D-glucuronyl C5-epimerase family protein [Pseudomonas bijieensis]UQI33107.1 D-glucuronyl C5-epimerase family protein [Pseudomonas bijieensis]
MIRNAAILLFAVLLSGCDGSLTEHWPEHNPSQQLKTMGLASADEYRKQGMDASLRSQKYSPAGDYLNYGKTVTHRPSPTLKLDAQGVPMVLQAGRFNYSAGTVAIAALAEHGRYTVSGDSTKFFIMADKLLTLMGPDGALRYSYPYKHYTSTQMLAVGWTSGMDQGMALSVFARAYELSKDKKWLNAGNLAFKFLQTPYPDGPKSNLSYLDKSLSGRTFYLEYPTEPNVYTLNGYMFTLLGLYDWAEVAGSRDAKSEFKDGIETLGKILPYYDMGTFSAYDLSYITHSKLPYLQPRLPHLVPRYHAIHIAQLRALWSVTDDKKLKEVADKWQGYVEAKAQ